MILVEVYLLWLRLPHQHVTVSLCYLCTYTAIVCSNCTCECRFTVYISPNPKQPFSRAEDCEQFCYMGRGDNSRAVFTVIDRITQTLHYSMHDRSFGLIGPRQVYAEYKCIHARLYIYASTAWRVTSSVPTQYRRYMYSSVADLMAAGSWQLTPVSQSPTCPFRAMRLGWPSL